MAQIKPNIPIAKVKQFLPLALLYVIGILVLAIAVIPGISNIEKLRSDAVDEQKTLDILTRKTDILNNLDETAAKAQLTTANNALPSEKSVPGLLSGLETMAKAASASADGFSIMPGRLATDSATASTTKEEQVGSGVYALAFKATLHGNYAALHDFLAGLYKVNRLIGVESILFRNTPGLNPATSTSVSSDLMLRVYYQPPVKNLGDITSPINPLTDSDKQVLTTLASYPVVTNPPPLVPTGKANPFSP